MNNILSYASVSFLVAYGKKFLLIKLVVYRDTLNLI